MLFSFRRLFQAKLVGGGIFLVVVATVLAVASRVVTFTHTTEHVLAAGQVRTVIAPLPKEFPLDSFVPPGVPVTLSNVMASVLKSDDNKIEGPAQVRLQVSLPTGEQLQSVNFVLLSFKSSGELELVKGWVRTLDFTSAGSAQLTLELNRRVTNGDKLVLAVERARSATTTYQTDFTELSDAVIANVRKQAGPPVSVQRAFASLPDETGADLCNNALRRAMSLRQSSENKGDKFGITALHCDQQDRSYTFTYGKPKGDK